MGVFKLVVLVLLSSVVLGIIFHNIIAPRSLVVHSDLVSFLTGAEMLKEGAGEDIYNLETQQLYQNIITEPFQKEILPFKNLAVFSLPFIPLTYLPLRLSYSLFSFFNLGLLGIIVYFASGLFKRIRSIHFWFFIPFVFLPNLITTILGQLSIILAFIFLLIYKILREKKAFLGGLLCALLALKPQYLISAPFFLVLSGDRKRFLYGFLASSLVIILSSLILTGHSALVDYPQFLLATENDSFALRDQRMFTVASSIFYNPLVSLSYTSAIYLNGALYLAGILFFVKKRKNLDFDLAFIVVTLLTLLFAVHVLEHDLAILTVPILILLNKSFFSLSLIIFLLPFIILMINPAIGGIITAFIVIALLYKYKKTNSNFLWEKK